MLGFSPNFAIFAVYAHVICLGYPKHLFLSPVNHYASFDTPQA